MSMTFQREPWEAAESAIKEISVAHWKELAVMQGNIKLDVNWEHYRSLAERTEPPFLLLTTGRTSEGVLVAYYVNVVNWHPHYKRTLMAFQDSYFMLPSYRNANVGLQLFVEMERNATMAGAQCIIASDKEHLSVKPLFEFCKFMSPGSQYMKWIGGI